MKLRLGSITYAMKAKDLLLSHGIDVTIVRDFKVAGRGCVYAITFPDRYSDAARAILEDGNITYDFAHRDE